METASYFIKLLRSIYDCKYPFELVTIDKRPKTKMGCYIIEDNRIRIYTRYKNVCPLEEIAIHEYAHHIHETELRKCDDRRKERTHGAEFWKIYSALMCTAIQKGLYHGKPSSEITILFKS